MAQRWFLGKFLESLQNVFKDMADEQLLLLAMDGSSVIWNVFKKLDIKCQEKDLSKTRNIESCKQLILHGALKTVAANSAWNLDKILKSMWWLLQTLLQRGRFMFEKVALMYPH